MNDHCNDNMKTFGELANRIVRRTEAKMTHRKRLMNGTSKTALFWGAMPKPDKA